MICEDVWEFQEKAQEKKRRQEYRGKLQQQQLSSLEDSPDKLAAVSEGLKNQRQREQEEQVTQRQHDLIRKFLEELTETLPSSSASSRKPGEGDRCGFKSGTVFSPRRSTRSSSTGGEQGPPRWPATEPHSSPLCRFGPTDGRDQENHDRIAEHQDGDED